MSEPLLLLTGFGPFEDVEENPSARLVERLDTERPEGVEVAVRILPVSFRGAVSELDAALTALEPRRPDAILCMGVASGAEGFRVERRASTDLKPDRPDILDVDASALKLPEGVAHQTTFDLEALVASAAQAGAPGITISDDAGGFVCERLYHHALERAAELGVPALFLHVPPLEVESIEAQLRVVRRVIAAAVEQLPARSSSTP